MGDSPSNHSTWQIFRKIFESQVTLYMIYLSVEIIMSVNGIIKEWIINCHGNSMEWEECLTGSFFYCFIVHINVWDQTTFQTGLQIKYHDFFYNILCNKYHDKLYDVMMLYIWLMLQLPNLISLKLINIYVFCLNPFFPH